MAAEQLPRSYVIESQSWRSWTLIDENTAIQMFSQSEYWGLDSTVTEIRQLLAPDEYLLYGNHLEFKPDNGVIATEDIFLTSHGSVIAKYYYDNLEDGTTSIEYHDHKLPVSKHINVANIHKDCYALSGYDDTLMYLKMVCSHTYEIMCKRVRATETELKHLREKNEELRKHNESHSHKKKKQ